MAGKACRYLREGVVGTDVSKDDITFPFGRR